MFPYWSPVGRHTSYRPDSLTLGGQHCPLQCWAAREDRPPEAWALTCTGSVFLRESPAPSPRLCGPGPPLTQDLHLDVAWPLDELLHKQRPVPEGGQSLGVGPGVVLLQFLGAGRD